MASRYLPFLVFLLFFPKLNCFSQCIADAGDDQHWCSYTESRDTIYLGDSATASLGTPPFSYEWSITPVSAGSTGLRYASFYLSDTTDPNPYIINSSHFGYDIEFFLKVKDSEGSICRDTTRVTISRFYQHLIIYSFIINKGDSVQLKPPNIALSQTSPPVDSVLWRPNIGLSDSNAVRPWAKPDSDVVYHCIIWDTAGCSQAGVPFQYVYVNQIGIAGVDPQSKFSVYPTLLSASDNFLFIEKPLDISHYLLKVFTIGGEQVMERELSAPLEKIDCHSFSKGTYLFGIYSRDNIPYQYGKILFN